MDEINPVSNIFYPKGLQLWFTTNTYSLIL